MIDCYCEKHTIEALREITAEVLFPAADGGWTKAKDTHRRARVAKLMYLTYCAHKSGKVRIRRCKEVAEFLVTRD